MYVCIHCLVDLRWWLSGKNLSAMQDTQIRFLDWEDPLGEEMATHSSILAGTFPVSGTFHGAGF